MSDEPAAHGPSPYATGLSLSQIRFRYFVLLVLRWMPTGILIPILVLLAMARGLGISEVGLVLATMGLTMLVLELPSGGLSDSLGRRPVLLLSTAVGVVALCLIFLAQNLAMFMVAYVLQGVYRALDSGPLESWFVDSSQAVDRGTDIEAGLSRGGAVMGVSVACGALLSGVVVALDPIQGVASLATPVLLGIGIQLTGLVTAYLLLREPHTARTGGGAVSLRAVPSVISESFTLVRRSPVVLGLVAVEIFWGFGMASFEILMPVKLEAILDSDEIAAAVMGPSASAAWAFSAIGAALIPVAARQFGTARTAATLRLLHGVMVAGIGLAAGPVLAIGAYLLTYVVHGASNPLHMTLLHGQVEAGQRSTVVSVNSMVSGGMASIGMVVLASVTEVMSVHVAMIAGAVVISVGALLYLPAIRQRSAM